jgi:hypothetical protein
MSLHKKRIIEAFHDAPNDQVRAKYRWLAKYHNRSLRGFPKEFSRAVIDLQRLSARR